MVERPTGRRPGDDWEPKWVEEDRRKHPVWEHVDPRRADYGTMRARAPARWDRSTNWFRKAPHPPKKR